MPRENDIMALTLLVQRMVDKFGNPQGFDTSAWLSDWLVKAFLAFDCRQSLESLKAPGGLGPVRILLLQAPAGRCS